MITSTGKKVFICIPAFNEEKSIAEIVDRAKEYGTQVIVYDDGSKDSTYEVAKAAGAVVVRSPINKGYGVAIKSLFEICKTRGADVMVTLDSDGQHDPTHIASLLQPILDEEVDIVIGSRFLNIDNNSKMPRYRSFGIRTITRLTQVASYSTLTDAQSGFRAYGRVALTTIDLVQEGMAVSTEILLKAKEKGLSVKEVPITINYDVDDPSTHNPFSHGVGVLYSIMQFISLKHPLAFYSLPGIILLVISIFYMGTAVDLYSTTKYISTNMILVSIGTAIVGVVLFATGVILYTLIALLKGRIR